MMNTQREIKFRAWDKTNKKWSDESIGFFLERKTIFPSIYHYVSVGFPNDIVIMQYTGLKDKNDRDIYVGDILRFIEKDDIRKRHRIGEVTSLYAESFHCEWHIQGSYYMHRLDQIDDIEIIGNIYQNPELFK